VSISLGTFCSGIGSPELAARSLGWKCRWSSEIEPFPSAVLAHHFPDTPNLGDMTKLQGGDLERVDVVFAGTPCQSFSVAGLRAGMADPRGNLALVFLGLVDAIRPKWLVWENVPGVLSSNGGRDFGAFLGALGQLGYGWAYRVLDAQFVRVDGHEYAVPQRRRRVFVVGHSDWRRAAAVLFERNSMSGNTAPSRTAGQGLAREVANSIRSSGDGTSRVGDTRGQDNIVCASVSPALKARDYKGPSSDGDGDGDGAPLIPICFSAKDHGGDALDNLSPTLRSGGHHKSHANAGVMPAVAFDLAQITSRLNRSRVSPELPASTLAKDSQMHAAGPFGVRRLIPAECERLQGYPDGWTAITHRQKPAADGPRYKAIGNSIAVNCSRWILERIQMVDSIQEAA
jgi:DNA (cytosine-5)-methyltransferase 1